MKKLLFTLIVMPVCIIIQAQPQAFKYQAIIRNSAGNPVINKTIGLQISILNNADSTLYTEQHQPVTNTFGLINVEIGNGTVTFGNFSTIDWSAEQYNIELSVDTSGGSAYQLLGSAPLLAVPVALYAKNADINLTSGNGIAINNNTITNIGDLSDTNEIQTLSLNGYELILSKDGGSVNIPFNDTSNYQAGAGISINGNIINNIGDLSDTNEIQTISLSGNDIILSKNGGTITLPSSNSQWTNSGNNIYFNTGYVGIGTNSPQFGLDVKSGIKIESLSNWTSANWKKGINMPLGTAWKSTDFVNVNGTNKYLGYGITSSGWNWLSCASDNNTSPPDYLMQLAPNGDFTIKNKFSVIGNKVGVGTQTPTANLTVVADTGSTVNDTLFVVRNKNGEPVFAVFPEGVRIWMQDGAKGNIGGFAISGRSAGKTNDEYFRVTQDSVRIYIKDTNITKGNIGGFAISGRSAGKSGINDFLRVTADSTRIYTGDSIKGFGIAHLGQSNPDSYLKLMLKNAFIGQDAGKNSIVKDTLGYTIGTNNLFIGTNAGYGNRTGMNNIYIGNGTGKSGYNPSNNVFIGLNAGYLNQKSGNTFIGAHAGTSNTVGERNTYLGAWSGVGTQGSGNVFLGFNSGFEFPNASNTFMVDNIGSFQPYIYGQFDQNTFNVANSFLGQISTFGSAVTCFSHRDCATSTAFAIAQNNTGQSTVINKKSGPGRIALRIDNIDYVALDNNGCFGIGTIFPSKKLDVDGNVKFRNLDIGSGNTIGIQPDGNLVRPSDDKSVLENIIPVKNSLNSILQLQGIKCNYINDSNKITKYSFIAQDVEKIFPEIVTTYVSDGIKVINYNEINVLLVEAIKEQQNIIEKQQLEIENLKINYQNIQNKLDEVLSKLNVMEKK